VKLKRSSSEVQPEQRGKKGRNKRFLDQIDKNYVDEKKRQAAEPLYLKRYEWKLEFFMGCSFLNYGR